MMKIPKHDVPVILVVRLFLVNGPLACLETKLLLQIGTDAYNTYKRGGKM